MFAKLPCLDSRNVACGKVAGDGFRQWLAGARILRVFYGYLRFGGICLAAYRLRNDEQFAEIKDGIGSKVRARCIIVEKDDIRLDPAYYVDLS